MRRLGAVPCGDGTVEVCVWAPAAGSVLVRSDEDVELERDGECWVGRFTGQDYLLVVDGEAWPDPCSRWQPEGVKGPSRVLDTAAFEWSDDDWNGVTLDGLVIYELHVGAFSETGAFDGVVPRLRGLRELGVTAIELMPVATFAGNHGWGYDGLYTYAVHPAYGGPHEFARLVDAAHAEGLGVILDVVYNHVGPGDEALRAFGPYFTSHETFWGDAPDYSQRGVREWAIQNAEQWVREFHLDGLRLDAVHAVFDDSPLHVCAELKQRVGAALVISETAVDDWRPIDDWGHDAQWADRSHHELHVLLTGERDGYYADYGSVASLAEDLAGRGHDPRRLVVCVQNHDQVGNRGLGDRLPEDALRVAAAVTLFSPCTPLLFMGEEWFETAPFQFFADHTDPAIAEVTRTGRRREFADFASFAVGEELPDPQALETFLRSKLPPREPDPLYRELLALRRELPRELEAEADEETKLLRLRRGDATLVADFGNRRVEFSRR